MESYLQTMYYQNLPKVKTLSEKHLVIATLKEILKTSPYIRIKYTDAFKYANKIYETFPDLLYSRLSYERIIDKLQTLMNYPHIVNSLFRTKFNEAYLRSLAEKGPKALKNIEKRLREEAIQELYELTDYNEEKVTPARIHPSRPFKGLKPYIAQRQDDLENEEIPDYDIPEGSILKIFGGNLRLDADTVTPKMLLYSCDRYETAISIPEIGEDSNDTQLEVTEEVSWNDFEAYFEYILDAVREKKKPIEVMAGWIEPAASIYHSRFEQIACDLLEYGKVAVCEYMNCAKLIIMNERQMKRNWARQLDFKVKKARRVSQPVLYYVIVYKAYKLKVPTRSIAPEIIRPIEDEENSNEFFVEETEEEEGQDNEVSQLEQIVKKLKTEEIEDQIKLIKQMENLPDNDIINIALYLGQPARGSLVRLLQGIVEEQNKAPETAPFISYTPEEPPLELNKTFSFGSEFPEKAKDSPLRFNQESLISTAKSTPIEKVNRTYTGQQTTVFQPPKPKGEDIFKQTISTNEKRSEIAQVDSDEKEDEYVVVDIDWDDATISNDYITLPLKLDKDFEELNPNAGEGKEKADEKGIVEKEFEEKGKKDRVEIEDETVHKEGTEKKPLTASIKEIRSTSEKN